MKKEIRNNQALYSQTLNFDPVNRKFAPPAAKSAIDPSAGSKVELPSAGLGFGETEFEHVPGYRTFDDGSIEVTYYAPNAEKVEVAGNGGSMPGRYAMEPCGDGYWKTTITDVGPGFHYHVYIVDGVITFNPTIPFGFGCSYVLNYMEIPDPNEDFYLLKDVPHGSVRQELLKSEITGRYRNLWVYTPYGYDKSDKKYPVMHILHGGGENEVGWFWQGKLNLIADNLMASGKCEEMIIVASCFAAPREVDEFVYTNESFPEVMTKEIIPFIDDNFRTIPDRRSRAMAGLSAGGSMSRQIAHGYPEYFANLGQFSCGAGFSVEGISTVKSTMVFPRGFAKNPYDAKYAELFASTDHFNETMDVTFITCGTEDPRHEYTQPQVQELVDKGYKMEYAYYPGYHEWDVWRFSARDFMKRVFK